MVRLRVFFAVLGAVLAGLGAQATAAPNAGRPNSCKLLASALDGTFVWGALRHKPSPGSSWLSCEYTDGKGLDAEWSVNFGFTRHLSAAEAHRYWKTVWDYWRHQKAEGLEVERLRGYGADDAFAWEKRDEVSIDTEVEWRRGRYEGGIGVVAPPDQNVGIDYVAEVLLKELMRGIPRR